MKFYRIYWLVWACVTAAAIGFNLRSLMVPCVVAFGVVEFLGLTETTDAAGTLTDTTATHVPVDLTFILIGLMLWRLSQWVPVYMVWGLGAWLTQHFIRKYDRSH